MTHGTMTTVVGTQQQQGFRGGNEPVSCAADQVAMGRRLKSSGNLNGFVTKSSGGGSDEEEGTAIRNDADPSSSGDIGSNSVI